MAQERVEVIVTLKDELPKKYFSEVVIGFQIIAGSGWVLGLGLGFGSGFDYNMIILGSGCCSGFN